MEKEQAPQTVDAYIAQCPPYVQPKLQALRAAIREAAPEATERMSWQMPTFYLKGNLVHFALHKNHIGLYPGASGVAHFEKRLEGYTTSKGAIQLPLSEPLPLPLVKEIVTFRAKENLEG